ncbi:MAG: signal peptide peptidase SppA [Pseudomonadota bacterium]|nr:signal peptide peptidase SppA [Pseudomonadota bacterium]
MSDPTGSDKSGSDATDPGVSARGTRGSDPAPPAARPRRSGRGARLLIGISVMGLVTLAAATAGIVFFARDGFSGGGVTDDSYLEVELDGGLADAPGEGGFVMDPADFPPLVTEVAADIRRAATDPRIKGLYLEVSSVGTGWAAAQELHDAIAAFTASGKPCHAYGETFDNKSYYVASACDNVYIAPAGLILLNGFSVTTEYFAGTLEKIGVRSNFEHVGDFKSAIEPFQRTGPSEAASIATDSMLDSLFAQLADGIAAGRGMTSEQVRAIIDNPPITPEAALAVGLVDGLKYRDEVREVIAGEERTEIGDYHEPSSPLAVGKTIAIVHAEGQIISGDSGSPVFGGSMVGDRTVAEMLEAVREDDDVVAVVLRVNSPGGSGLASDAMWHDIKRVRDAGKPVVVSMGDYAASGGYYIAAAADFIVAEPGTLTGSIGVFGGKMNLAGLYEKLGITMHTYQRGQLASLLSPTSDFSEPERAKFREFLEGFYQVFLTRVADGRGMTRDQVHEVAQGRVWTGVQAKERGLVDELGGLDVAIAKARVLANITEGEDISLLRLPKRRTFVEQIVEDLQKASAPEVSVPVELLVPGVAEAYGQLFSLARVLDDGAVTMLPGSITIE